MGVIGIECPNCGKDLEGAVNKAYKDKNFELGEAQLSFKIKCNCGKELIDEFFYYGMWDPKNQEYIFEY